MNKQQIINRTYKNGKKADGLLMACYSKEIFTRDYIERHVKHFHASSTAINTGIDHLLEKINGTDSYIKIIGRNGRIKLYTITDIGEQLLYTKYPGLAYQMASLLDSPGFEQTEITKYDSSSIKIKNKCNEIRDMLLDKNARYGNSSLNPPNYFNLSRDAKIEARIEDKMARITRIDKDKHRESYMDAVRDLIGYLVLYLISLEQDE